MKLFALEDDDTGNDLLIDKILAKAKQPKQPMVLTANLLKQRQEIKKQVDETMSKDGESKDEDDTSDDKSTSGNSDTTKQDDDESNDKSDTDDKDDKSDDSGDDNSSTDNASDTSDRADSDSKNDSKEDKGNEDDAQSKTTDKQHKDDTKAADTEEGANALIGSALESRHIDTPTYKKPIPKPFKEVVTLNTIFTPVLEAYTKYKSSMSMYALEAQPITERPIAYVREPVIKSLNNLVTMANKYINNNITFSNKMHKSVSDLNERITVFKTLVSSEKFHFTNKLVTETDILSKLAVPDRHNFTIKDSSKILLAYLNSSSKATRLAVSNDYDQLPSAYINSGYTKELDDYTYKDILPGFNMIKVSIEPYKTYTTVKIANNQYYKVNTLKTEDYYDLSAISISEDTELNSCINTLDKLISTIALSIDNLSDINTHFTTFIDQVKVIIYDVGNNEHANLASIDIDSKVKDFIRYKLALESLYININLIIEYITSVMSVVNICVELKE